MNGKKTKKENKTKQAVNNPCLCQGLGPALTEFLQQWGPPEAARAHFESARIEFLKGLRAVLDARIEKISRAKAKGEKIVVE